MAARATPLTQMKLEPLMTVHGTGTNGNGAAYTKLRGGYYTPEPIAAFLASWAVGPLTRLVLEPSAGDGSLVAAAASRLTGRGRLVAIEIDRDEAEKVAAAAAGKGSVIASDFFSWYEREKPDAQFDAVIGNPPFVRYQDFPESQRQPAFSLMQKEGLHPSRLTNAWLPFVVAATRALRPGGRLALVLPAELLQVGYAGELREYLVRQYMTLTLVTFRSLVFPTIQQEIVLLLGERGTGADATIRFVELESVESLRQGLAAASPAVDADLNHAREKWTQYYLTQKELGLVRELECSESLVRLGDLARVDVGVVTGRNEFFVMSPSNAREYGLAEHCVPLVGRSSQIPGLVLSKPAWLRLAASNEKCFLLQLGDVSRQELPAAARRYVEMGEKNEVHTGYKCRIRMPRWWNVPSVWEPDAFMLRQIHDAPRIVQNKARVTCTDTLHRVRVMPGVKTSWLAAASVNSITLAFAEIRGRSYGGGVLELEPSEAEGLPFPHPSANGITSGEVNGVIRKHGLDSAVEFVDGSVLRQLGLTARETTMLRVVWRKLYMRRKDRKRH